MSRQNNAAKDFGGASTTTTASLSSRAVSPESSSLSVPSHVADSSSMSSVIATPAVDLPRVTSPYRSRHQVTRSISELYSPTRHSSASLRDSAMAGGLGGSSAAMAASIGGADLAPSASSPTLGSTGPGSSQAAPAGGNLHNRREAYERVHAAQMAALNGLASSGGINSGSTAKKASYSSQPQSQSQMHQQQPSDKWGRRSEMALAGTPAFTSISGSLASADVGSVNTAQGPGTGPAFAFLVASGAASAASAAPATATITDTVSPTTVHERNNEREAQSPQSLQLQLQHQMFRERDRDRENKDRGSAFSTPIGSRRSSLRGAFVGDRVSGLQNDSIEEEQRWQPMKTQTQVPSTNNTSAFAAATAGQQQADGHGYTGLGSGLDTKRSSGSLTQRRQQYYQMQTLTQPQTQPSVAQTQMQTHPQHQQEQQIQGQMNSLPTQAQLQVALWTEQEKQYRAQGMNTLDEMVSELRDFSTHSVQYTEDSYRSVIEMYFSAQQMLLTLRSLVDESQGVTSTFISQTAALETDTRNALHACRKLDARKQRIDDMHVRITRGRAQMLALTERVDVVRNMVERWETADGVWQERTRKRLRYVWMVIIAVATLALVAVVVQGPGTRAGDDEGGGGSSSRTVEKRLVVEVTERVEGAMEQCPAILMLQNHSLSGDDRVRAYAESQNQAGTGTCMVDT